MSKDVSTFRKQSFFVLSLLNLNTEVITQNCSYLGEGSMKNTIFIRLPIRVKHTNIPHAHAL